MRLHKVVAIDIFGAPGACSESVQQQVICSKIVKNMFIASESDSRNRLRSLGCETLCFFWRGFTVAVQWQYFPQLLAEIDLRQTKKRGSAFAFNLHL